jgi:hypothetical protein
MADITLTENRRWTISVCPECDQKMGTVRRCVNDHGTGESISVTVAPVEEVEEWHDRSDRHQREKWEAEQRAERAYEEGFGAALARAERAEAERDALNSAKADKPDAEGGENWTRDTPFAVLDAEEPKPDLSHEMLANIAAIENYSCPRCGSREREWRGHGSTYAPRKVWALTETRRPYLSAMFCDHPWHDEGEK